MTVNVVDVNDLYAKYTYGIFDPPAIKQYIAYAAKNLGTKYVLLVGGDTYDYRNYLGMNSISFIPSLYAATGPIGPFCPGRSVVCGCERGWGAGPGDRAVPGADNGPIEHDGQQDAGVCEQELWKTAVFASDLNDGVVSFKDISNGLAASLPAVGACKASTWMT